MGLVVQVLGYVEAAQSAAPDAILCMEDAIMPLFLPNLNLAISVQVCCATFYLKPLSNYLADGTCGGTNGFICAGSTFGDCCSGSEYCGNTDAHCKANCQKVGGPAVISNLLLG